jgi:ElaA protein
MIDLAWTFARLERLSPRDVYDFLALRSAIFVVEQHCVFMDPDGFDDRSWHLLGRDPAGRLVAYLRIVDPGIKYPEPSIGRVTTRADVRRLGYGIHLMEEGIRRCRALWPESPVKIGAQQRLERFYAGLGFNACGEPYIEDDIPHIEMVREAVPLATNQGDSQ